MSHGITNTRDFVYGLAGQGNDWHGLTIEKDRINSDMFPEFIEENIQTASGLELPWRILISKDDGKPCADPFNPETFGYITPQTAWHMVEQALTGTKYTVERMGMLWNRSFWFVSICLDELKELSRQGEYFRLNFSGGLDGSESPQGELSHIRAVCWNTISASRRSGEYLFKVRQTINSGKRLELAQKDVEKAVGMAGLFNKTLKELEETSCNQDTAMLLYAGDVARRGGDFSFKKSKKTGEEKENRARNTVNEMVNLFKYGKGNEGKTLADVLNGYSEFMTHGRKETKTNIWRIAASSEFGGNSDNKANFMNCLVDEKEFTSLVNEGEKALATV